MTTLEMPLRATTNAQQAVRFVQCRRRNFHSISDGFSDLFGLSAQTVLEDPTLFESLFEDPDLLRYAKRCAENAAPGAPLTASYELLPPDDGPPLTLLEVRWLRSESPGAPWEGVWQLLPPATDAFPENPVPRMHWHDLVNLIGGVSALSELCSQGGIDDPMLAENLEMIAESSRRAHALAQQIAALSKRPI